MHNNKELTDILKKDGKDWTPAESRIVAVFMKSHGRGALKKLRLELRGR